MPNKVVLITGGNRGIGAAVVRAFSGRGYSVIFTYNKNRESAEEMLNLIRKTNKDANIHFYDASSSESAGSLISFTMEKYSKIDVLVNNAGISFRELATHTSDSDFRKTIDVNLSSVFYLCREAAKRMISRKSGSIINISSVYGIIGASMESVYSAAKAGVIGFSKALSRELALSNITVNCIAPGVIDTEMVSWLDNEEREMLCSQIPLGRFGTADEVADAVLFLAESAYITGQVLCVDGGLV